MRGKDVDALGSVCRLGITPAYAGKRDGDDAVLACFWDHPRVCGEKGLLSYKIDQTQGSPPRMRGKGDTDGIYILSAGITPAYAGKSLKGSTAQSALRDHPRVCGEKLFLVLKLSLLQWITPAYAGKRLKRSHSIGHFSCILRLFHSVLHRASASGGSRAGPCAPPCLPAQNAVPV